MYIKVWRDREEDKQNIIPDSLKQNTSKCCVTEARHVTKPVWFLPQVESALMRGMTAKCSSIQPNLRKTKQNNDLTTSLHVFFSIVRFWNDWGILALLWSYLHVSKPLMRAFCTCSFEAMFTPSVEQSFRASEALKA